MSCVSCHVVINMMLLKLLYLSLKIVNGVSQLLLSCFMLLSQLLSLTTNQIDLPALLVNGLFQLVLCDLELLGTLLFVV